MVDGAEASSLTVFSGGRSPIWSPGRPQTATLKSQPVLARTSATVTPGCNSVSVSPCSGSTSKTHRSVMIMSTTPFPVMRQRALREDLRAAVFGGVIHHHDHALDAGDQIHGAAGPFDHLARHHPVGQVAVVRYLQAAQDGKVDMAAADHREGVGAAEKARPGKSGDGLLAGVDEIGIDAVFGWVGTDAEQPVLRLQCHIDVSGMKLATNVGMPIPRFT